jgi:hypothetical protein
MCEMTSVFRTNGAMMHCALQQFSLTARPVIATSCPLPMNAWETYKKWFYAWEEPTARLLETWLKSPLVLEPAGAWLSAVMKGKAASEKALAAAWGAAGLATKRDQERALHALNQIQSRLLDLEEELAELRARTRS